jgi:hypothetical protein
VLAIIADEIPNPKYNYGIDVIKETNIVKMRIELDKWGEKGCVIDNARRGKINEEWAYEIIFRCPIN